MTELEKVKKGLECLARKQEPMANPCSKCDYHDRPNFAFCVVDVATDALALLKEQEAVTVKKTKEHGFGVYGGICPKCHNWIQSAHSFCGFCGQAVKWE